MKKILLLVFAFLIFPFFVFAADNVEINTASLEQLETLTGIGPVKAQAIIDARPFSSVDDLIRVKGIGEKTLQKIKNQGIAYVEDHTAQSVPIVLDETPADAPIELPDPIMNEIVETTPLKITTPIIYPSGIVFNEILPSPKGPDEENEWIEIFNQNNSEVNLSGWKIEDKEGKITTYVFPEGVKVSPFGFLVLKRPETKIILNNSQDSLNLLYPNGETADSISFEKSPLGQSYNKTQTGWKWSTISTPGEENIIPTPKPLEQKPAETGPRTIESLDKKTTAAIGEKIIKPLPENFDSRSLLPLLIAFAVAIFSAGIILFLKKTRVNQSR